MEFELSSNLSELLPPLYRDIEEYQQICTAEEAQFVQLSDAALDAYRNFFIQTMNLDSVRRWENVLAIRAAPTSETLAFRQQRILSRLRTRPPYTLAFLHQQLDALIGEGCWECGVDYPNHRLSIGVDTESKPCREELAHLLTQIKPAHILLHHYLYHKVETERFYVTGTACGTTISYTVQLPGEIGKGESE